MTYATDPTDPILLVVNPISGDLDKTGLIHQVKQTVHPHHVLKIYVTTGADDQTRIAELFNTFPARRVLVAGGDGTIKMMAEVLRDQQIPLGILPTGSANGLARSLDLPALPSDALRVALGNHFQEVDALCINNELCLHISDLGLNAELIRHYERGSMRGILGYALQTIPTLISSDMPYAFDITANGLTFRRQGILLAIANAQKYGTGATINPNGRIDDGKFELLIFKKLDVLEIAKTLREEVVLDDDFMEAISTTQAVIRCQQPVPFQIDGEYYGEVQQIDVSILPRHLKIAIPE
ncbi:MAG: diacylglycerol kinase family protein [Tunicatimonas sp.]